MTAFAGFLGENAERYIELRRSLGYAFNKQAGTLRAFVRYVERTELDAPATRAMALNFVLSFGGAANSRAIRHSVLRRFYEYLAVYDSRTEALECRAFSRSRAIPPPRILSEAELASLIDACGRISPGIPLRGRTMATLIGLLASSGLRSGEVVRLDRSDVDLANGVLLVRKTKFRKDRLVPVHATTQAALRRYARERDAAFPRPKDQAFFLSSRGNRLSAAGLQSAFAEVRRLSEATGVNANDFQLERSHPQVLLRGKGRRDRVVPIPKDLVRAVTALLEERGIAHHEPRPIFVGAHNERLTRFGATHIVRRAAAKAVAVRPTLADKPISPHVFRHSLAMKLLQSGVDLLTIQAWLGHAQMATSRSHAGHHESWGKQARSA